jgi:hypothetical protein
MQYTAGNQHYDVPEIPRQACAAEAAHVFQLLAFRQTL